MSTILGQIKRTLTRKKHNKSCSNMDMIIDPKQANTAIDELFIDDNKVFDKTNPAYDKLTEYQFNELKKDVKEIKKIVIEIKSTPISQLPIQLKRLEKVDVSIIRCNSEDIFGPDIEITEPTFDQILETNGKSYIDWVIATEKAAMKGGKSRRSKKSRKSRK